MIEGKEIASAGQLRYGMLGGGEGSFIGDVHRKAIAMDGLAQLVAGCFSIDYEDTLRTAKKLRVADDRVYKDYVEMARKESGREDCIDFVDIATPNNTHYPIAREFLNAGINVVCEKPLTIDLAQAEELAALARKKGLLFAVTYTYSGYVMVKQAREMIRRGDIGEIRVVMGEYARTGWPHVWRTLGICRLWRTDPSQTGRSNCVGI
jgi:predicted dehydrogenase